MPDISARPNVRDPNFRCGSCKKNLSSERLFVKHMAQVHSFDLNFDFKPIDRSLFPDLQDPNFHCKVCKLVHACYHLYLDHLRDAHEIVVPVTREIDNSCGVCNAAFAGNTTSTDHLSSKPNEGRNHVPQKKQDPYCSICDKLFPSALAYQIHTNALHEPITQSGPVSNVRRNKVETAEERLKISRKRKSNDEEYENVKKNNSKKGIKQIKDTSGQSDAKALVSYIEHDDTSSESEDDTNNQKRSEEHLQFGTKFAPPLMPDENDQDYCCACKRQHPNRKSYRFHLTNVHKRCITRRRATPDNLPDPNHPHYYCSICELRCISKPVFHFHLKSTHALNFKSE